MQTNDNKFENPREEHRDFFTTQLQSYAEDIGAILRDSLEVVNNSYVEATERFQEHDWSETANDIYEALNDMDNSPIAQLIHGVAYGATDQAIKIAAVVVDKVVERFGESQNNQFNDSDSAKNMAENLAKNIQNDINNDALNPNWQANSEISYDPLESMVQEPDKDYLEAHVASDSSAEATNGLER